MNKREAQKAYCELLKDLAAADLSLADYIDVLEDLISDAQTARDAAQEDRDREEQDDDDEEDEDDDEA